MARTRRKVGLGDRAVAFSNLDNVLSSVAYTTAADVINQHLRVVQALALEAAWRRASVGSTGRDAGLPG